MADEPTAHAAQRASTIRTDRRQLILAGKIAAGIVVAILVVGVIAPIVLAVVVGLADGH
jgi:hypothetical protein